MTGEGQALLDTLLSLETSLQALDEQSGGEGPGEVPSAVEDFQQACLRLTNQMREARAALDYCLKVNRQVAAMQAEETSRLVRALEEMASGPDGATG
jgi:hypothetical protein